MFGSMEMDFGAQKEDTNFQFKNSKRKLFLYAHTHNVLVRRKKDMRETYKIYFCWFDEQ